MLKMSNNLLSESIYYYVFADFSVHLGPKLVLTKHLSWSESLPLFAITYDKYMSPIHMNTGKIFWKFCI